MRNYTGILNAELSVLAQHSTLRNNKLRHQTLTFCVRAADFLLPVLVTVSSLAPRPGLPPWPWLAPESNDAGYGILKAIP